MAEVCRVCGTRLTVRETGECEGMCRNDHRTYTNPCQGCGSKNYSGLLYPYGGKNLCKVCMMDRTVEALNTKGKYQLASFCSELNLG